MQAAIAAFVILSIGLLLALILGPLIAGVLTLVIVIVLMAISLPFMIIMAPWLVIGGLVWLIFF